MIAGISLLRNWRITGGIIIMIAHGIVSSALFCLAKIFYERTNSRTLTVKRGLKTLILTLPLLWLIFACANLGLPPFPKAIGELLIFSSITAHKLSNFIPIIMGILFTGIFSLIIYQSLNRGSLFKWNILNITLVEREYLMLTLHLLPLILLITSPSLMSR